MGHSYVIEFWEEGLPCLCGSSCGSFAGWADSQDGPVHRMGRCTTAFAVSRHWSFHGSTGRFTAAFVVSRHWSFQEGVAVTQGVTVTRVRMARRFLPRLDFLSRSQFRTTHPPIF